MSTYQGDCGHCDASGCCSAPVLPSYEAQLTSGQASSLRAAAIIYGETVRTIRAGGSPRFASNADYNQYKKARALASGAGHIACRPPPSAAVRQIEAIGCPACNVTISILNVPIPIPIPYMFGYKIGWDVAQTGDSIPEITVTTIPAITTIVTDYAYGIVGPGEANVYFSVTDPGQDVLITATFTRGGVPCSGSTKANAPCFLAGSLVTLADGTAIPIEEIAVGDNVRGAFGETNTVLALHRPLLGTATMSRINNEHSTTSHHPHISPDRGFFCLNPAVVSSATYGREHEVLNATGETEMRMLHGLRPDRIHRLAVGQHLKTVEGSRVVGALEEYTLPPLTQLYNLVVSGSHTYHVDGYAVTGWPREDDFDYDSWTVRT